MNDKHRLARAAIISAVTYTIGYLAVFLANSFFESGYNILPFYLIVPLILTVFCLIYSLKLSSHMKEISGAKRRIYITLSFLLPAIALTAAMIIIDLIRHHEIFPYDYKFMIFIFICIAVGSLSGCNLDSLSRKKAK